MDARIETMTKGEATRERLLEIAEEAIVAKGFSNTSIDEIIAEAGMTKSGFFYHFKDKTELARALIERFIRMDKAKMDEHWQRGSELSDDPLQQLLISLRLFAEQFADLEEAHPGCIVASVAYHDRQFNDEVRDLNAQAMQAWIDRVLPQLENIAKTYPPKIDIELRHLTEMLCTIADGGLICGRTLQSPKLMYEQIMAYRKFVQAVFLGA